MTPDLSLLLSDVGVDTGLWGLETDLYSDTENAFEILLHEYKDMF